jgi:hypothetical protein
VNKNIFLLFLAVILVSAIPKSNVKPKLIVVISVDQMRGDYIERFKSQMPFVYQELYNGGLNYVNTHHFHAKTTTAAGHATLATGCLPSTHGIVDNNVYLRATRKTEYSILDTSISFLGVDRCSLQKVSAAKLQKPSIGDYIKMNDPQSKSYSVALKDRSSILMGGHLANRAYWFDGQSTQMVSTNYYAEPFPEWVKAFRADQLYASEIETGWLLNSAIPTVHNHLLDHDSAAYECGTFQPWFPHTLKSIESVKEGENKIGTFMWNTPYGDEFVLKFAEQLIVKNQLGSDEHTDVLTISLSAADVIGHQFGPNSVEIADYYTRLDQYLKVFITMLNQKIGKDNYILALTADHGVVPMPEFSSLTDKAVRVESQQFDNDMLGIDQSLKQLFNLTESTFLEKSYEGVEPNFELLTAHHIDSFLYLDALKERLKKLSYVDQAYTPDDFIHSTSNENYKQQFKNSYDPRFGYYVLLLCTPLSLVDLRSCGTTHGTPYSYDTHVPFIIYTTRVKRKKVSTLTQTIDIAPTLLGLADIDITKKVDGRNLLR